MKIKYSFLWIDDDQSRKEALDTLKKRLNVDGEFINVSKENIATKVDGILSEPKFKFDIILIDHFLDDTAKNSIQTGSTTAEYIREKRPDCPIVGITAAEKATDIDYHKKSIYEDLLEVSSISDHYNSILSIAAAYRTLVKKRPQSNEDLIKLLKAPKDVKERLTIMIPEDIKRNYKDKSLLINISKWVRHGLMSRPGFLYDNLSSATLLGLKEESFVKVKNLFEKAKYNGLFSDEDNVKWWQTQIRQILYAQYPEDKSAFPWQLGHKLLKTKKDHSVCHVCGKEFPETVGYTDETCKTRAPMHVKCSLIHPNFEITLYYDDVRIMEPAK
jgi:hypothetical protein